MSHQAYIGIGSNLGDRLSYCRQAIEQLRREDPKLITSACYETDPLPGTQGGKFLNGVIRLDTQKTPLELLDLLQSIEESLGRQRGQKWGERTIDLDLLLYGQEVIQTPQLTVPHPEMHRRLCVLKPLAELASDLLHPVFKKSVRQLLKGCPDQGRVVRYGNFH